MVWFALPQAVNADDGIMPLDLYTKNLLLAAM